MSLLHESALSHAENMDEGGSLTIFNRMSPEENGFRSEIDQEIPESDLVPDESPMREEDEDSSTMTETNQAFSELPLIIKIKTEEPDDEFKMPLKSQQIKPNFDSSSSSSFGWKKERRNAKIIVCSGCPRKIHTWKGFGLFRTTLYKLSEQSHVIRRELEMKYESDRAYRDNKEETEESKIEEIPKPKIKKIRKIKCPECPEKFTTKQNLDTHWSKHNRKLIENQPRCFFKPRNWLKTDLIQCRYCSYVDSVRLVRQHTILHEVAKRKRPKMVRKSRKILLNCQTILKRHQKLLPKSPRVCSECFQLFDSFHELIDHFKRNHNLECVKCSEVFDSFGAMWRHKAEHKTPKPLWDCHLHLYQCSDCPRTDTNAQVMARHVKCHSRAMKADYNKCSTCSFRGNHISLRAHERIHVRPDYKPTPPDLIYSDDDVDDVRSELVDWDDVTDVSSDSSESESFVAPQQRSDASFRCHVREYGEYGDYFDSESKHFKCDLCPRSTTVYEEFHRHIKGHFEIRKGFVKCAQCTYHCNPRNIPNHMQLHRKFPDFRAGPQRSTPSPQTPPLPPPYQQHKSPEIAEYLEKKRNLKHQKSFNRTDSSDVSMDEPLMVVAEQRIDVIKTAVVRPTIMSKPVVLLQPVDVAELENISDRFDRTLRMYKCDMCPLTCHNPKVFRVHLTRHRSTDPSFARCRYCSFRCKPAYLGKHEGIHQSEEPIVAPKIPENYNLRDMYSEGMYRCPECPRTVASPTIFEAHLKMHLSNDDPDAVQCEYCSFKTKRQYIANHSALHFRGHNDDKPTKPETRNKPIKVTTKSTNVGKTAGNSGSMKCQYCTYRCNSGKKMGLHIKDHFKFGGELTVTTVNGGGGGGGGGSRGQPQSINEDDVWSDDTERARIIGEMSSFYDAYEALYKCPECPRVSREPLVFADHWRGHTITDEDLAECKFCSFRAKPQHLTNHMKLHARGPLSPPILDYYGKPNKVNNYNIDNDDDDDDDDDEEEIYSPPEKRLRMDLPQKQKPSSTSTSNRSVAKAKTDDIEIVDLCDDDDDLFMVSSTTFVCPVCQFESLTHDGLQTHKCKVKNVYACDFCKFVTKYGKCLTKHVAQNHPDCVDEDESSQ